MTVANPYLQGNYGPVAAEVTVTDLSGDRFPSGLAQRSLPPQRAESRHRTRSCHLPLVHGRRDGAWHPDRGRKRTLVPESMGPFGRGGRGTG